MFSLATDGYTEAQIKDALHASGREIRFRYELLDSENRHLGWIDEQVKGGRIKNNSFADVKRTAKFELASTRGINFLSERIRPWFYIRMPDRARNEPVDAGAYAYRESVVDNEPVGYWRFGDDVGATTAAAVVGPDGTLVGTGQFGVEGALSADPNTALHLDETAYMDFGSVDVTGQGSFSAEIWVKPDPVASDHVGRIFFQDEDDDGWAISYQDPGEGLVRFYARGQSSVIVDSPNPIPTGEWSFLSAVYDHDAGMRYLYINGVEVASASVTPKALNPLSDVLVVGANHVLSTVGFPGAVDEPAVYNRALSAGEVSAHYEASQGTLRKFETVQVWEEAWASFPLGVFLAASPGREIGTRRIGPEHSATAYDQLLVLGDHRIDDRYSIAAGENVIAAVRSLVQMGGVPKVNIPSNDTVLSKTREWDIGTSVLRMVNDLLATVNYRSIAFDGLGRAFSNRYQRPDDRPTEYTYQTDDQSLLLPAASYAFDLFGIPNRWIGVVSNSEDTPLVSTYQNDNPDSPTSTVNVGRIITDYRENIDVPDQATLDSYLERLAFEASQVYERVQMLTLLMPHHEDDDLLRVTYPRLDVSARYVETEWEMDLRAGGSMRHKMRRLVGI